MAVESKVIEHIRNVLETFDDKYILDGRIKKTKVIEDLDRYDHDLIKALLSDDLIHNSYTEKIADVEVFKVNQFIEMLEFKKYWEDSYTKYSNKIGLTAGGKFIDESTDVVLDFPFKDTVLKAGMSKEDLKNSDDADEPFLNEVIAKPEIDELFEPKVLVNARRYDNSDRRGYETSSISDDDNLVIKGNNLIALYSLKKRYMGKIKSIFIDPPYYFEIAKPADTFSYNSNFKLSAWLTFMKNRLEISRQLLNDNGILSISISDEGAHYLKVLCDSCLGRENFIADVTWESRSSISSDGLISMNSNHILIYAKDLSNIDKNSFRLALDKESFKYDDNNGRGAYRIEPFDAPNIRKNLTYTIVNPKTGQEFLPPKGRCWRTTKENFDAALADGRIRFGQNGKSRPQLKVYYTDVRDSGKGKTSSSIFHNIRLDSILWLETNTNTSATKHQRDMFGEDVFTNPKPEELVKRILELSTNKNDIVLDFFMGSATTQAVAMKMRRRFIGIEQMDYINAVSIPRLQKVIEGEQGGISKDVNWQGGGSFVYAELMEKNQGYLKDLQKSESIQELMEVYERMKENADIDFRLDLEKFEEEINNFNSLDERRRELIRILDKNQLYYNYANIDDANVRDLISDNDYEFNKSFYNRDGE